jgi:hypothetical protein
MNYNNGRKRFKKPIDTIFSATAANVIENGSLPLQRLVFVGAKMWNILLAGNSPMISASLIIECGHLEKFA